jgi:hypothetical protein
MKKITKLTPEQEAQIPEYVNRWISIASEPMNHDLAKKYIQELYQRMGKENPLIVIGYSPLNAVLLCAMFKVLTQNAPGQLWDQLGDQLRDQLGDQLGGQLWGQLRGQLWDQLRDQLGDQLWDQLRDQLRDQLGDQLGGQLRGQLGDQLRDQLWDQLRDQLGDQLWDQLWGQLGGQLWGQLRGQLWDQLGGQLWGQLGDQLGDQLRDQLGDQLGDLNNDWLLPLWHMAWAGWFEFAKLIGVQFDQSKYDLFTGYSKEVQFIIPYGGIVFLSEKPSIITWKDRRLHNDAGPSVLFDKDGYSLYCLSGVRVPEKLVVTPADQLDPEEWINHENAEVRAQFIRKFGIERLKAYGETVDRMGDYELINLIKLFPRRNEYTPYLFMTNPSTGTIHAEGVNDECRTCKSALAWRDYEDEYVQPDVLT